VALRALASIYHEDLINISMPANDSQRLSVLMIFLTRVVFVSENEEIF